ncbi:MAG: hypothetical protein ACLVHC_04770, partial [Eggerthella lenta]
MPRIKFRSGSSVVTYCPYRVGDLLLSMSSANPSDEFPEQPGRSTRRTGSPSAQARPTLSELPE